MRKYIRKFIGQYIVEMTNEKTLFSDGNFCYHVRVNNYLIGFYDLDKARDLYESLNTVEDITAFYYRERNKFVS